MTTFRSINEKIHPQLIFCMVVTLMVHPRIMKIHKKLPGDNPNICNTNILFSHYEITFTISFLYGDHPNGTP